MNADRDPLVTEIIGCAIAVHDALGPGLLESAYRYCLKEEFTYRGTSYVCELALPLTYRNVKLDCGYRVDFVIEQRVVLELKTVDRLAPVHQAQLITYMKLLKIRRGLLINFNVSLLKYGIRSIVLNEHYEMSPPGVVPPAL